MGYNQEDKEIVLRHIEGVKSVLDMGSANDYTYGVEYPPFISEWYKSIGIYNYACIDLAGDNNALKYDVSHPVDIGEKFDMLVNAGFSEHVVQMDGYVTVAFHDGHINSIYPKEVTDARLGFYYCWKNMFSFVINGGIMIHVNPKSGYWEGHGYTYLTREFYVEICKISDLEYLELYEHGACGNWETGINIVCVLKKTGNTFPSFEEFSKLPIYTS